MSIHNSSRTIQLYTQNSTIMKLLYFFVVVIMAVLAGIAQAQDCLPNGSTCEWQGSMGNCCSGFCLQQPSESTGVCQDR
ncbi:unnamed protein product [Callosobruchus maculatus]|uniref:Uncharacterized protein n=1 Tax=Callosobruchus maculatus TaxID=64391 RepID=A0A653BJ86_CALMS|nr:unnamed protein product [Callosobruchus maculatus]